MKSVRICDATVKSTVEGPCENTVAGTPVEKLRVCFDNAAGNYKPGKKFFECGVVDEVCILIEGEVIITDDEGNSETYVGGEAFVLPAGFKGHWETVKPVRKYWVQYFNK
ncbi:hypothetical protein HYH02_013372 [Chlamydomonas schloesseri]|uniref:(S)-ureidoglycine aminohydrolase cupin domain-containing protein n=1 Tax=Chlamydomonas schloesseri TaxID=2026947 RepID=A0A835T2P9_9CHLO|nr:hypothetical protein HYH02_013372 [Chlamydomonas schloesseri]|eukprot:KAG2431385.1 hypothetical protein HYH02_013372 [Chlamydomonas schloesseri]